MYIEPDHQLPQYALSLEEKRAEAFMRAMQPLVEWTDRTSKIVVRAFDSVGKAFVDALEGE
jgi:hypothetical protein